jgi:hypothetical protein
MNNDLSGQKFGKWLVFRKVKKPDHLKGSSAYYECQCDCGKIKIVKAASLRSGDSVSCGCFIISDLSGERFGQLVVISIGIMKDHVIFCPCKCDCGLEKLIRQHDLTRSDNKAILSCGHDKIHSIPEETKLSTARAVYRDTYNDGNLSFEKFLELSQLPCHYCSTPPNNRANIFKKKLGSSDFAIEHGIFIYNGLDRLDNNYPHNVDNVIPSCIKCNWAKSKMSYKEFLEWISIVYRHRVLQ